jgi:hypothetical protein
MTDDSTEGATARKTLDADAVRAICAANPGATVQRMRAWQNVTAPPLHVAAMHDSVEMIDVLLALGADRDAEDEQHRTAIDLALNAGKENAYARLAAAGARASTELIAMVGTPSRAQRMARLHHAIVANEIEAVARELDADPSLINQPLPDLWGTGGTFGAAPLHWAARFASFELVRLLIARGASLTQRDLTYDGTPLAWAKEYRRTEMVAYLEAHQPRGS